MCRFSRRTLRIFLFRYRKAALPQFRVRLQAYAKKFRHRSFRSRRTGFFLLKPQSCSQNVLQAQALSARRGQSYRLRPFRTLNKLCRLLFPTASAEFQVFPYIPGIPELSYSFRKAPLHLCYRCPLRHICRSFPKDTRLQVYISFPYTTPPLFLQKLQFGSRKTALSAIFKFGISVQKSVAEFFCLFAVYYIFD